MSGPSPAASNQPTGGEVTHILRQASTGDPAAAAQLYTRVYDELRAIAQHQMRGERASHTLGATALVHEAYLRLIGIDEPPWRDRTAFFHAAAEAMRRILIEHARQRGRQKRGGGRPRIPLDVADLAADDHFEEILAVDEAVRRLETVDAAAAEVVRLRFFAGLSVEEVAALRDSSPRTVAREWAYARAWLYRALCDAGK